jgi:hypothetical protein
MSDTSSTPPTPIAEQLGGQDSSRLFHKLFTGHVVGKPAMGWAPLTAVVVGANENQVIVTIDMFNNTASAASSTFNVSTPTFSCNYEPRFSGGSQVIPPVNTPCLVVFPPAGPQGSGYPWVIAFGGWPTGS